MTKQPKRSTAAQHSEPALRRVAPATAAQRGQNSARARGEQLSPACPKSEPDAVAQQQGSVKRSKGMCRPTGLAPVWITLLSINCYLLLPLNGLVPKMRF